MVTAGKIIYGNKYFKIRRTEIPLSKKKVNLKHFKISHLKVNSIFLIISNFSSILYELYKIRALLTIINITCYISVLIQWTTRITNINDDWQLKEKWCYQTSVNWKDILMAMVILQLHQISAYTGYWLRGGV